MKDYVFLNRAEYYRTLTKLARTAKSGQRIMLATMDINPDEPLVHTLVESLKNAARLGVDVLLILDAHNFMITEHGTPGPLFYRPSLESLFNSDNKLAGTLKALQAAGGKYWITNLPKRRFHPSPVGRSHIKGAVVGNRVFIGGCNLEKARQIDLMVTWEDKKAADTLTNWLGRITESTTVREAFGDVDAEITLDATTRLLMDAGVPGQSVIYDEALKLVDEASTDLLITCQYFPGGPTAAHLAAAQKRQVTVEIMYGHPRSMGSMAPVHHLHQMAQRTKRLPPEFFTGRLDKRMPKLHAKVLVSDKAAMVGSHNFVTQGVQFGTAELAMHSTDTEFGKNLRTFMRSQLAKKITKRPSKSTKPKAVS